MSIKLYAHPISGFSHRPRLLLNLLNLDHELIEVDLAKGDNRTDEFLKINPLGKIPVLVDNGTAIFDSTAILVYLASKYDKERTWLPADPVTQAHIQSFLSIAVKEISDGPNSIRLRNLFDAPIDYDLALQRSKDLLAKVFEPTLGSNKWLVGQTPTIADVACYGYIAKAPEGGLNLEAYPATQRWLKDVESLDRFVPILEAEKILGREIRK